MQSIQDVKGLIRRRYKIFLLAAVPLFIAVTVVAFILPPIYVSKSTILVESQQIPEEFVRTTVTSFVEERLQMITQQIMSRSRLLDIIKQYNLYPEMRKKYASEIVLEKMKKDITLETIKSDQRSRRASTIAFTLAYEGKDPDTIQRVAGVLASLYLEENLKKREAQATRTTQFLQNELSNLKTQIDGYAKTISEFKNAHLGELPEYSVINMQALEQLRRDIEQANMQIRSLQERITYLEGQLANIDNVAVTLPQEGQRVTGTSPGERLRALRLELIREQARLSDRHPDIIKLKREISDLEAMTGHTTPALTNTEKKFHEVKAQLVTKKSQLGARHPEVVRLEKELARLSKKIETESETSGTNNSLYEHSDNPAYVTIKTQLDSANLELKHFINERGRLQEQLTIYQKKIENASRIEREYTGLQTDYENAKKKYNEVMDKLLDAKVALGMEETQHGERFTIIEPANRPETPEKPDRKKILLMGLFLALGAGAGLGFVQDNFDRSIKTPFELDEFAHIPVLSSIPFMEGADERKKKHRKMIIIGIVIIIATCIAITAFHFLVMPLDILWMKFQKRIFMQI